MTERNNEAPQLPPLATNNDEIDLRDIAHMRWLKRWLIAGLALVGAALGVAASLSSTRYVSEGLFMVSSSVDAYKRYESVLLNGPRLEQFLQQSADPEAAAALRPLVDNDTALRKAVKPEFGFTDKDAKALGVQSEAASTLIGFLLRHEHATPIGGAPVVMLSEFVRDTIIRIDMEAQMLAQCNSFRTREQTLRNEQIQHNFEVQQQQQRIGTLKTLIERRPDVIVPDSRQIVSVEQGSERFLSPLAQLTAAEILVADMRLAEALRARERTASALKRDYYCKAQQVLQEPIGGRTFLEQLNVIQTAVFEGKDRSADIIEKTWNELDVERANWTNTYLSGMRFLASPDGSEVRQRKPGIALAVVLGLILGGMIGVLVALILGWWRGHPHGVATRQVA